MKTEIHQLSLGVCNCYLIKEEGLIMVDAGFPNQGQKFLKELKDLSIEPKDISLILLTHGHWDHIGSTNELKRLTGGKVAINQPEKSWIELIALCVSFQIVYLCVGLEGNFNAADT